MSEKYLSGAKHESKESREVFKATLGFDFIFVLGDKGKKRILCVEINGDNSGIAGIQNIPSEQANAFRKYIAGIRGHENPERVRRARLSSEIRYDIASGEFPLSKEASPRVERFLTESTLREPLFLKANKNPPYINSIAQDKSLQADVIPEHLRPRAFRLGGSSESSTGSWILKPRTGMQGENIRIYSNRTFKEVLYGYSTDWLMTNFTIQEFHAALGAETTSRELATHPASMRLLIDFVYREDGTIEPTFETAYQRVSPLSRAAIIEGATMEKICVVNKSTGASSVEASAEETAAAHAAAMEIIERVAQAYIKSQSQIV